MSLHRVKLHANGPALWPGHKPLKEVLHLKRTSLEMVWEGTYQGNPSPPGGYIFKKEWWHEKNRYDWSDHRPINLCIARYISFDTAQKDDESNDLTGYTVAELMPDYRLNIRYVDDARLEFPDLISHITHVAKAYNRDGKLRAVVIEDKSSGTSALQTLRKSAEDWLAALIVAFNPTTDKTTRFKQAAAWCKLGCVLLPFAHEDVLWLYDFEQQLFGVPQTKFDDMTDSFAQLILYLENLIEHGYRARKKAVNDETD